MAAVVHIVSHLTNTLPWQVHAPKRRRVAHTAPELPVIPKSERKVGLLSCYEFWRHCLLLRLQDTVFIILSQAQSSFSLIAEARSQVSATLFVFGQGDSGQLGLGELISEDDDLDEDDPSEIKMPRVSTVANGEKVSLLLLSHYVALECAALLPPEYSRHIIPTSVQVIWFTIVG